MDLVALVQVSSTLGYKSVFQTEEALGEDLLWG